MMECGSSQNKPDATVRRPEKASNAWSTRDIDDVHVSFDSISMSFDTMFLSLPILSERII